MTNTTTISNKKALLKQRITLFIKPAMVKHARAQAVVEGITLTGLFEKALLQYLPLETVVRKADD